MGRKHFRRGLLIAALLLIVVAMVALFRLRLVPIVRQLASTRVANEASTAMNRAVIRLIEEDRIAYDRMIFLEKNASGEISAIRTNMAELNRLKSEVLQAVDEEIMEISVSELSLPLGNLIFPELLAGKGPGIPVRVLAVSASDARFDSTFSDAGINQTIHRIVITINATMTILTPLGTHSVTSDTQVIGAETVIIGTVPQTYWNTQKAAP